MPVCTNIIILTPSLCDSDTCDKKIKMLHLNLSNFTNYFLHIFFLGRGGPIQYTLYILYTGKIHYCLKFSNFLQHKKIQILNLLPLSHTYSFFSLRIKPNFCNFLSSYNQSKTLSPYFNQISSSPFT